MARRLRVVIIGAGIGGLTAARALRLRGHNVELYERATSLGEVGAGLQVGPSAVKVLYALGLRSQIDSIACAPENFSTFNWSDGALVHREPFQDTFKKYGAPYLTAHRADLHQLLVDGASGSNIHVSKPCVSVTSTDNGAVAHFADGSSVECDVLIGADGIRSAVRETLWGKESPRYTHYTGWRGVVPMEEALAVIGNDKSAEIHRKDVTLWRSPMGTMLFYPLRAGELLNVFGGKYTDEWAEESWTVPSSREELNAAFEGWPAERRAVFDLLPVVHKWGIFDRDPLPQWSKDNISLLGDAAHPMMPTLAQGAAIAIEDAFALARHLDGADDVAAALKAYQDERIGRAGRVQILARDQFEDNRKSPPPAPRDRTWIFEHDVTKAAAA